MAASVGDCIFCKIVRREAPASIVREDGSTLAFMDIQPMNPGHVLVIPKAHAAYVEDLPGEAVGPILEASTEISHALRTSGIRCEAVSFYLANGREAGQEVLCPHARHPAVARRRVGASRAHGSRPPRGSEGAG